MLALIDGDLVAYRCAASANNDVVDIAIWRTDDLMHRILKEVNATEYFVYLSGSENFRKTIDPTYKANRVQERPKWLEDCREHLVTKWNAKVTEEIEADDAIGIEATRCFSSDEPFVVCSLDKDFRQLPGRHYSWEISGRSGGTSWTKKAEHIFVSPMDALKNFYMQMLIGDASDNIKGVQGIAHIKAAKLICPLQTEEEMIEVVKLKYNDDERYEVNKRLLTILKELPSQYIQELEEEHQSSSSDSSGNQQDPGSEPI